MSHNGTGTSGYETGPYVELPEKSYVPMNPYMQPLAPISLGCMEQYAPPFGNMSVPYPQPPLPFPMPYVNGNFNANVGANANGNFNGNAYPNVNSNFNAYGSANVNGNFNGNVCPNVNGNFNANVGPNFNGNFNANVNANGNFNFNASGYPNVSINPFEASPFTEPPKAFLQVPIPMELKTIYGPPVPCGVGETRPLWIGHQWVPVLPEYVGIVLPPKPVDDPAPLVCPLPLRPAPNFCPGQIPLEIRPDDHFREDGEYIFQPIRAFEDLNEPILSQAPTDDQDGALASYIENIEEEDDVDVFIVDITDGLVTYEEVSKKAPREPSPSDSDQEGQLVPEFPKEPELRPDPLEERLPEPESNKPASPSPQGGPKSRLWRGRMGFKEGVKHCKLCRSNRETSQVYMGHILIGPDGRVTCPILRTHICPRCGATGDSAHTIKYCPHLMNSTQAQAQAQAQSRAQALQARNTYYYVRSSTGKLRSLKY